MRGGLPARLHEAQAGTSLVLTALGLFAIAAVAALVLDIAAVRSVRSSSQGRADAAAGAGALALSSGSGVDACLAARAYLLANFPDESLGGLDCSAFPVTCHAGTAAATTTATSGDYTVAVTHPVPDDHPLMLPGAVGSSAQPASPADGSKCERLGVSVAAVHQTAFAGLLGADVQHTEVHSVALNTSGGAGRVVSLLLLERHECESLTARGSGGGVGGISVGAMHNPFTGELEPGVIAADSDGTSGCTGNGVLDIDGGNALVRADGPPGCPTDTGGGSGCGEIKVVAPGPPGCNDPACTSSGTILPAPQSLSRPLTRAVVDHIYNCKPSYPASYDIAGCREAPAPHIDDLAAAVGAAGTPPGWQRYTAAGYPCTVDGPDIVVPPGNWHVDCASLDVTRELVFSGGSVVFDGPVSVAGGRGVLAVNAHPADYSPASEAAVAYFRLGTFSKSGQGSVVLPRTLVYLSADAALAMSGGSGSLAWTAPITGPFQNLALWSESPSVHELAGQADLAMEGVFFTPLAEVHYRGNGAQQQVAAQFISGRLGVEGRGVLDLQPVWDRAVRVHLSGTELIR